MTRHPAMLAVLIACLTTACAEVTLPRTAVTVGHDTTFGTDLAAPDPVLGVTIDDPLQRLP